MNGCTGSFDPDQAVTSALLKLGSQGNVRTETLRGYSPEEFKELLSRMS